MLGGVWGHFSRVAPHRISFCIPTDLADRPLKNGGVFASRGRHGHTMAKTEAWRLAPSIFTLNSVHSGLIRARKLP